jgi:hypothetical protein
MAYNHLRNLSKRYCRRDTQQLDYPKVKETKKDVGCEGVNPIGTIVKMRTKPIKSVYVTNLTTGCHFTMTFTKSAVKSKNNI